MVLLVSLIVRFSLDLGLIGFISSLSNQGSILYKILLFSMSFLIALHFDQENQNLGSLKLCRKKHRSWLREGHIL